MPNGGCGGVIPSFFYMKTARGIYHNLQDSDYIVELQNIRFYFSSKTYRDKFAERLFDEIERFNTALNMVYKNTFDLAGDVLAMVRLYNRIEKRGFYIEIDGNEISCLENLAFDVMPIYKKRYDG